MDKIKNLQAAVETKVAVIRTTNQKDEISPEVASKNPYSHFCNFFLFFRAM